MSVLRKQLDSSFTIVPNELLEDSTLDFAAKGLVAYMLSRPDGWSFTALAITKIMPEGRTAITNAMTRAIDAGWVKRVTQRRADGTFFRVLLVRNNRQLPWETVESADAGKPDVGLADVGSTVDISTKTEGANTEEARTEVQELATSSRERDVIWDTLVSIFGEPTDSARGSRNAACKTLRNAHAEPDEIEQYVRALERTDVKWAVQTPTALAKWYGQRMKLLSQVSTNHVDRTLEQAEMMRSQGQ